MAIPLLTPLKYIEMLLQATLDPVDPLNSRDPGDLCVGVVKVSVL